MTPRSRPFQSSLKNGFKLLGRAGLTVAFIAAAVLAVQSGAAALERRADAAALPAPASLAVVQTLVPELVDSYVVSRRFTGQVEPDQSADLSFELSGRLIEMTVDEGDSVVAGQELARLDTTLLNAEVARLEATRTATMAQLKFANQTVARNDELTARGFTSQVALDEALSRQDELRARVTAIDAQLAEMSIRLEKSRIMAPFSGRITARLVDIGQTLTTAQTVLGLVDTTNPIVRVGLASTVEIDALQDAMLVIDGRSYPANLRTLRPDVDPVTRARIALFDLPGQTAISFGQTATLIVKQSIPMRGLWLPVTSLQENANGQWTVLTVDNNAIIHAAPVEVLHAEASRVFVRATLPEGTRLISGGPQRLTTGQQVSVTQQR